MSHKTIGLGSEYAKKLLELPAKVFNGTASGSEMVRYALVHNMGLDDATAFAYVHGAQTKNITYGKIHDEAWSKRLKTRSGLDRADAFVAKRLDEEPSYRKSMQNAYARLMKTATVESQQSTEERWKTFMDLEKKADAVERRETHRAATQYNKAHARTTKQ